MQQFMLLLVYHLDSRPTAAYSWSSRLRILTYVKATSKSWGSGNGYLTTFLTVQTLGGWKASRAQLSIICVTKYITLCKIRRFAELYGLSFSVAGTVFHYVYGNGYARARRNCSWRKTGSLRTYLRTCPTTFEGMVGHASSRTLPCEWGCCDSKDLPRLLWNLRKFTACCL